MVIAALSGLSVWLCAQFERRGVDILNRPILGLALHYIGARSYTIYVFHMILAKIARYGIVEALWREHSHKGILLAGVFIALLVVVTECVHRLIESPLREFGKIYAAKLAREIG